jgi:hypothetical protein
MSRKLGPLAALAVVALIGAGAGCSNADNNDDAANANDRNDDAANTSADSQAQGVKFAECMRENGVSDFPDPNTTDSYGVSVSPAVFTNAVHACKDLKPPGALSAERTPEQQSATLEFAQCIRDNGVPDFPDPVNGAPVVDTTAIPGPDTPEFMAILNAAMEKCGDLIEESMGGQ